MLIVGTHHAREINVPLIGLLAADNLTTELHLRPQDHCGGRRPRDLDCSGLESGRLQPRLHDQQHVEEEPPDHDRWRGRRSEPQLRSGVVDVVRRQHQSRFRYVQRTVAGVRAGDPDADDLVAGGAVRQGHRLSLQRPRSAVRVPLSRLIPSRAGCSRRPRRSPRRPAMGGTRENRAPKGSTISGSSPRWAPTRF